MLAHPGFIKAIRLNRDEASDSAAYPFCLPAIRALERLELPKPYSSRRFSIADSMMSMCSLRLGSSLRILLNSAFQ